jgi:hypothetical protein
MHPPAETIRGRPHSMAGEEEDQIEDQIEDNLGDDSDEVIPFKYSITSYGADYPVDGLVKRMKEGNILIPPFQRGFMWDLKRASLFVESLLLGLPVPGIFLSREQDTQKLMVIDGQQRLRTLEYFYRGVFAETEQEFALKGVPSSFEGVTYKSLGEEDRLRLDDSILHATIIKQDEPSDDDSSVYHVFERLNTGGVQLQPQEIRACMYHGKFNDLLKQLNQTPAWRSVYGNVSSRMRDQELILRFLALYLNGDSYEKPMKGFLNKYMGKNRRQARSEFTEAFIGAIDVILGCLGGKAFKPRRQINAAVYDAVMVGIARRLERGPIQSCEGVHQSYSALLKNRRFVTATKTGTADEENVSRRLELATKAFAQVE